MIDHPHIHCVVPAGAISDDGVEWIHARKGFLFPVDVLKRVYRGKFMSFFKEAVSNGTMQYHGSLQEIIPKYRQFLDILYTTEWVVYLKESFASPTAVIKYLGAYTNRIAISNSRIKCIDNDNVTFSYHDRKNGNVEKRMILPIEQFIQQFLLHVLPPGFVRIRYFGFMANRNRTEKILQCRVAITAEIQVDRKVEVVPDLEIFVTMVQPCTCPHCKKGKLILIEEIPKRAGPV
jgi:hypothetical protein